MPEPTPEAVKVPLVALTLGKLTAMTNPLSIGTAIS